MGLMRSRVSGRWCRCCSEWTAERAKERRAWRADVDAELGFSRQYRSNGGDRL